METVAIRSERRGRKRRRHDVQNGVADRQVKKQAVGIMLRALVGRYVMKEFGGNGIFLGKVVHYDTGLYRVEYEDGDCEDLESAEVTEILFEDGDIGDDLKLRKKKLDELLAKKDVKDNGKVEGIANVSVNVVDRVEASSLCERVEASSPSGLSNDDGDSDNWDDADSSSDSCEHARHQDSSSEVSAPVVPPPELPPSSGSIGVPEEYVSHLFSVYGFLRSFSIRLFLSPFELDDFVGSLNGHVPNTLLDAIHLALMRALRHHLQMLFSDGSDSASKCLRLADWNLLDTLTWPAYLVRYLMVMGYANGPEWKGFYTDVLEKDYYTLSAAWKLMVLQILCDDVLDSEELRAEIDMREESEVGINSDAVATVGSESGPRRVHPRYSKTSACRDEESVEIMAEPRGTRSSSKPSFLGVKGSDTNVDADAVNDGNSDECRLCGMDGTLLCCDGCPSAYHSRCIGVTKMFIPEGAWYCPECIIDKTGPTLGRGTSLRGAEVFGVDSYGQVFLGTCNHLLVYVSGSLVPILLCFLSFVDMLISTVLAGLLCYSPYNWLRVSIKSEPCLRYYNMKDIPKALQALHSSLHHIPVYSEICRGVSQYWGIQNDILPRLETIKMFEQSATIQDDVEHCNALFTLSSKGSHEILDPAEGENLPSCKTDNRVRDVVVQSLESHKVMGFNKSSLDTITQPKHPSQQRSGDILAKQVCLLKNTELSEQSKVDPTIYSGSVMQQADSSDLTHQSLSGKPSFIDSGTCTSGNSNDSYGGQVSGIHVAVNNTHSQTKEGGGRVSGRGYKISSDGYSYMGSHFKPQAYVNNYTHGDFAASAAAKLAILLPEENQVSGSQASDKRKKVVAANNLLQVKAFSSAAIRFFWPNCEKKLVEVPRERCGWCLSCKAAVSCKKGCLLNAAVSNAIKGAMKIIAGLRTLKNGEGSLPGIATYVIFMEESLCGLTVGLFRSATYRKQWRKQVEKATTCSEVKVLLLELEENIRVVAVSGDWYKLVDDWSDESSVTQSATFAAGSSQKRGPSRRRGRKRFAAISEVTSDDCLDDSSDVRYLDLHVRWSDLVCPEQNLQEGKGPETEASAFRNAFVQDKKNVGDKIMYGVVFEKQKHLPSRVMKNLIELDQSQEGIEKYWFSEVHIPLYLIKEYEEKLEKKDVPFADKIVNAVSKLKKRQLKASRILSIAVHAKCTISSTIHENGGVKLLMTCKQCDHAKTLPQTKQANESPTSPLLLLGQESQNAVTVGKGAKRKSFNQPVPPPVPAVGLLASSLEMKSATPDSSSAQKNQRKLCSWGLIWKKNKSEDGTKFRLEEDIILRGNKHMTWSGPVCHLCNKPYNSDLTYIRCETCKNWYHAEAVELDEAKISELMGFKCCRCRRIRTPMCPYMDPESKKKIEAKKPRTRAAPKAINSGLESDSGNISEPPTELESNPKIMPKAEKVGHVQKEDPRFFPGSKVEQFTDQNKHNDVEWSIVKATASETGTQKLTFRRLIKNGHNVDGTTANNPSQTEFSYPKMLPKTEEVMNAGKGDPRLLSPSKVEQFLENNSEMDLEWNTATATASGTGPQKLPVRRHIKTENNIEVLSRVELSMPIEQSLPNSKEESFSPNVEWDLSENGFEDGTLVDYEGLNHEDVEFEPQTYFSFTELLVSDDGGRLDEVDASGFVIGGWENSSEISRDGYLEQCGTGTDSAPCHKCSRKEPCPDLSCEICGLSMHTDCVPGVEQSSWEGNWSELPEMECFVHVPNLLSGDKTVLLHGKFLSSDTILFLTNANFLEIGFPIIVLVRFPLEATNVTQLTSDMSHWTYRSMVNALNFPDPLDNEILATLKAVKIKLP
ncbi:hypothetical protein RHGRI_002233 [Rhododendron griersonianum]|uniref:Uncharacterized protein n=1 Tax=Rhododendron griersonianum TaxID=479676 RepID=A0AAV6LRG4_9ERIC|nr:hypothetical protein RHGRI_002233 [Rhododendron griersonianum]